jgi:branched-chain amino acid transport system substrate-binding protein
MKPNQQIFLFLTAIVLTLWSCAPVVVKPPLPVPEAEPVPLVTEETLFLSAEALFETNALEAALNAYSNIITSYPESARLPEALMKMGTIRQTLGDNPGARIHYQQLVDHHPNSPLVPQATMEILSTLFNEGKFKTLIDAGSLLPEDQFSETALPRLFKLLGDSYLAVNLPADAVYYLARLHEKSKENEKKAVIEKIKIALILLDTVDVTAILNRIGEGAPRELVQTLAAVTVYNRTTIGCLLPLSGTYKTYGQKALNGILLSLNRHNAIGTAGSSVRLIIKDTASDNQTAARAVEELAEAHVAAIIGSIATAGVAAAEAQAKSIPIITLTQKDGIIDIGNYVFRNFLTPSMQVKTVVSHAVKELEMKRFAILYPDEKYGRTFMNLFWDEIINNGATIVGVESYATGQTDFGDAIKKLVGLYYPIPKDLKLKAMAIADAQALLAMKPLFNLDYNGVYSDISPGKQEFFKPSPKPLMGPTIKNRGETEEEEKPEPIIDFDGIFIPDGPASVGLILPQLAFYDINETTLLGTNLWHSNTLIKMASEFCQGAILPEGFFHESASPLVTDFLTRFRTNFKDTPGFIEAVAYDTASILLTLINRPDIRSRDALRDEITKLKDFPGITGPTSFDHNGEVHKIINLLQVKQKKFIELEQNLTWPPLNSEGLEPDQLEPENQTRNLETIIQ